MKKKIFLFLLAFVCIFASSNAQLLNETFDGAIPDSWTVVNNDGGAGPVCPSATTIDGRTNFVNLYNCGDDYLITPALQPTATNNQLTFKAAAAYSFYNIDFQVLVSTTGTAPADFTDVMQTWTGFSTNTWAAGEYTIDLSVYNDTKIYVALYTDDGGYDQWGVDDFSGIPIWMGADEAGVNEVNSPAEEIAVGNHDVEVTIENYGSNALTTVDIEWSINGVAQATYNWTGNLNNGETELVTIGSADFNGLNQIVVNSSNPNGNPDPATENDTAYKQVLAVPTDYVSEGFETGFPPTYWEVESISGYDWELDSYYSNTGNACAGLTGTNSTIEHSVSRLITPKLTIEENDFLSFYGRKYYEAYADTLFIEYSADGTSFTAFDTILLDDSYEKHIVSLDAIAGNDCYISFKGKTYYYGDIYLDDIVHPALYSPEDDAAISAIVQPSSFIMQGEKDIIVTLYNNGSNELTSVDFDWEINTVAQATYNWTGNLASGESADVTIGSYDFEWSIDQLELQVNTTNPNGTVDPNTTNDTLTTSFYALHENQLYESFELVGFPPQGWDTATTSAGWQWNKANLNPFDGDSCAYYFSMNPFTEDKMITPKLTLNAGDKIVYHALTSWPENNPTMKIMYSEDKATWTDIVGSEVTLGEEWTKYEVDLSSLAGNKYYLAIAASCTNMAAVYVDYIVGPLKTQNYPATFTVYELGTTNPIEGAEISVNSQVLTTDASGVASITLEEDTYAYSVSATDYNDTTGNITFVGGALAETVYMSPVTVPTYPATFTVYELGTTDPIEGAEISINSQVWTTNASGEATINLEDGTYAYSVSADDYNDTTGNITVAGSALSESVYMSPVPEPTYTVTFTVLELGTTNAIEGAEISINSEVLTTDATGVATIDLEDGAYNYTITSEGYDEYTGTATIAGAPVSVDVEMTALPTYYTVTFTVTDNDGGAFIEGATIEIDGETLTTNASGVATIDLVDGTYGYTVSATDYLSISADAIVNGADLDVAVGMDDNSVFELSNSNINIYPNPSNGVFHVEVDGVYEITVINIAGEVVYSATISSKDAINLSNESVGIYFMQLKSKEQVINHKIMIK